MYTKIGCASAHNQSVSAADNCKKRIKQEYNCDPIRRKHNWANPAYSDSTRCKEEIYQNELSVVCCEVPQQYMFSYAAKGSQGNQQYMYITHSCNAGETEVQHHFACTNDKWGSSQKSKDRNKEVCGEHTSGRTEWYNARVGEVEQFMRTKQAQGWICHTN